MSEVDRNVACTMSLILYSVVCYIKLSIFMSLSGQTTVKGMDVLEQKMCHQLNAKQPKIDTVIVRDHIMKKINGLKVTT